VETINIPLLNDEERKAVGTDYKQHGQSEAIKTAFRMVGPRLIDIINSAEVIGKEMIVHCWRGGMRSENFSEFVGMAGIRTHRLDGGYKTYRHKALDAFEKPFDFKIIGGLTGSGKSEILRSLAHQGEQIIDLEFLASHKGSVFGGLMMPPQPTSEQFQNDLFEVIRNLDISKPIWIEDESVAIGKIFLPEAFWKRMRECPVVEIRMDKPERVNRLVKEYGLSRKDEFLEAMQGIEKRLGGQHMKAAKEYLEIGDWHSTIDTILTYYDKAYTNGLMNKQNRVVGSLSWDGKDLDSIANELLSLRIKSLP
jgi:tRNA 2-selenouridine synthase